ncbi:MAG: hypothetical protein K9L86_06065 [Candidatus Omnitrophica bacterium]|nr:hypothetical protein [Candidatus Omnitrophota bacterium]
MIEEIKGIKSDKRELARFGLTLSVVFILWGLLFLWRKGIFYPQFFVVSFFLFGFSFIFPLALKPLHKILRALFIIVSWALTGLILSILFYLVVTPIAVFSRLFGKKFLDSEFNQKRDSYWILKPEADLDKKYYENQF